MLFAGFFSPPDLPAKWSVLARPLFEIQWAANFYEGMAKGALVGGTLAGLLALVAGFAAGLTFSAILVAVRRWIANRA